jgi:predicted  nucleic acid-binding Zn-ribbon protein
MKEVKSRARADANNLEMGRGVTKMLQITCDQLTLEKEEEKECVDKLEQKLKEFFTNIPNSAQEALSSAEEQIQVIVQTLEEYRQEIEDLKENINPTTLLEVQEWREQQYTLHIVEMEKEVREVADFFNRTVQIWTILEEDEKFQQWDQQEDKISISIHELKQ